MSTEQPSVRRHAVLWLSRHAFADMLSATNTGTLLRLSCPELPEGAKVLKVWYDWSNEVFWVKVEHESFAVVEGYELPQLGRLEVEEVRPGTAGCSWGRGSGYRDTPALAVAIQSEAGRFVYIPKAEAESACQHQSEDGRDTRVFGEVALPGEPARWPWVCMVCMEMGTEATCGSTGQKVYDRFFKRAKLRKMAEINRAFAEEFGPKRTEPAGPEMTTAADEQFRCCVLDATGNRCHKQTRYWVGTNGVDDYTYCCAEHLASVRGDGDTVREVG